MSSSTISPPCQDCGRKRYPHSLWCSRTRNRVNDARFAKSLSAMVLEYIEQEPGSTAADVAEDLRMPSLRASACLEALFRNGRLVRDAHRRPRVGKVYAYRIPGLGA